MNEQEENLPELFVIDYYSKIFIGQLIKKDESPSFVGFILYFNYHVICVGRSKKLLIDAAENMCFIVFSSGLHFNKERTSEILDNPYNLN